VSPGPSFLDAAGVGPDARGVRGWLRLLVFLLVGWEPISLGLAVARLLPTLGDRGLAAAGLVALRVLVAGLGVAAALALWNRRPHAVALARVALIASGLTGLVVLLTPILPSNRLPGTTLPLAAGLTVYYGAWLAYLSRSRRVRETFGG